MLYEIILALAGHPGSVILFSKEKSAFFLDADIPFVDDSEKEMINQICALGRFFKKLDEFARENMAAKIGLPYSASSPFATEEGHSSMYVRAVSFGINEILDSYLLELTKAEQRFIQDPILPLSHLSYTLSDVR